MLRILLADEQLDASIPHVRAHAAAVVGANQHVDACGRERAGGEVGIDADEKRPNRDER